MSQIRSFSEVIDRIHTHTDVARIAVVNPSDSGSINAIRDALTSMISRFILVGSDAMMATLPDDIKSHDDVELRFLPAASDAEIAAGAVSLVNRGEAEVLMKGLIHTDDYLRAILNKQTGLLPPGNTLTHLTIAEIPTYHKLLFFSDVAVIPYPTLKQRIDTINYDLAVCRKFGIERPKVALIHFTEQVNPKFPNSTDYVELVKMAQDGEFESVCMWGPMDVKTACDIESARVKGMQSEVCGDADLLIFPNIESGNTFYKTVTLFCNAPVAGVLQGAKCPVILPSRSDSPLSKFYSMAVASAISAIL